MVSATITSQYNEAKIKEGGKISAT